MYTWDAIIFIVYNWDAIIFIVYTWDAIIFIVYTWDAIIFIVYTWDATIFIVYTWDAIIFIVYTWDAIILSTKSRKIFLKESEIKHVLKESNMVYGVVLFREFVSEEMSVTECSHQFYNYCKNYSIFVVVYLNTFCLENNTLMR